MTTKIRVKTITYNINMYKSLWGFFIFKSNEVCVCFVFLAKTSVVL